MPLFLLCAGPHFGHFCYFPERIIWLSRPLNLPQICRPKNEEPTISIRLQPAEWLHFRKGQEMRGVAKDSWRYDAREIGGHCGKEVYWSFAEIEFM